MSLEFEYVHRSIIAVAEEMGVDVMTHPEKLDEVEIGEGKHPAGPVTTSAIPV